jgi:hypothetical protein
MKKYSITLLLTCLVLLPITAQTDLEQVLGQIENNNKSIQALRQNLEAWLIMTREIANSSVDLRL